MKVLIIDEIHPCLEKLLVANGFQCTNKPGILRDELISELKKYDGLVLRSTMIDQSILEAGTRLKFLARAGSGLENIDLLAATDLNIDCFNSPEGNRDAVGEHALGMLLCLFNQLHKANAEVKAGKWNRLANRGIEIRGKTIGIIGFGNTGSAFSEKLSGFQSRILAYDKYKKGSYGNCVENATMDQLFEEADVLSLHLPLTEETKNLVNLDFIHKFKKPFYLINTARGKIVNTADLVKALEEGTILGACLDVLEYEKSAFEELSSSSSALAYLTASEKVLLSPHTAGWTHESNEKIAHVLAEKIITHYS